MKKLFIGLLIAAAGAGIFFALRKQQTPLTAGVDKSLLIGSWQLDSLQLADPGHAIEGILPLLDSNLQRYSYEFRPDNAIALSLNDSLVANDSRYEWRQSNQLI